MRQLLNKRKPSLRPLLKDFGVGFSSPGSRTHTLSQSTHLYPDPKYGDQFYDAVSESLIFGGVGNFPDNGARVATAIVIVICNSDQKTSNTAKLSTEFRPTQTHIIVPSLTCDLDIVTCNL